MNAGVRKTVLDLLRWAVVVIVIATGSIQLLAQKVQVGFDKSVKFLQFKTFSIAQPETPPSRPMLYLNIVGIIEHELKSKGFTSQANDGDLIVIPSGGLDVGLNLDAGIPIISSPSWTAPTINATMWTGAGSIPSAGSRYVNEGELTLTFVDRKTNQIVWVGTVKEKFDVEKKKKSLERVEKAIVKLLAQFPTKT